MDGLDIAYCKFTSEEGRWAWDILAAKTFGWSEVWRDRLTNVFAASAVDYARMDMEFGKECGRMVADFIAKSGLKPDFLASHGHTVFHQPQRGFTAQIGSGEALVAGFDFPVVTNFRQKNVAVGGQGAPLVPFGETMLFPEAEVFLNLGGIANVTIGERAWDICPCNMALNFLAQRTGVEFDRDGELAASGNLLPELLETFESLSYYTDAAPKTLGREWFAKNIYPNFTDPAHSPQDLLRTFVEHIVRRITSDIPSNSKVIVTGGGAQNKFLMQELEARGVEVAKDVHPLLGDYKEAMIFAFLGLQVLLGKPNILGTATGSSNDMLGGSIHLPAKGFKKLL